jgi:hypothetical protein
LREKIRVPGVRHARGRARPRVDARERGHDERREDTPRAAFSTICHPPACRHPSAPTAVGFNTEQKMNFTAKRHFQSSNEVKLPTPESRSSRSREGRAAEQRTSGTEAWPLRYQSDDRRLPVRGDWRFHESPIKSVRFVKFAFTASPLQRNVRFETGIPTTRDHTPPCRRTRGTRGTVRAAFTVSRLGFGALARLKPHLEYGVHDASRVVASRVCPSSARHVFATPVEVPLDLQMDRETAPERDASMRTRGRS